MMRFEPNAFSLNTPSEGSSNVPQAQVDSELSPGEEFRTVLRQSMPSESTEIKGSEAAQRVSSKGGDAISLFPFGQGLQLVMMESQPVSPTPVLSGLADKGPSVVGVSHNTPSFAEPGLHFPVGLVGGQVPEQWLPVLNKLSDMEAHRKQGIDGPPHWEAVSPDATGFSSSEVENPAPLKAQIVNLLPRLSEGESRTAAVPDVLTHTVPELGRVKLPQHAKSPPGIESGEATEPGAARQSVPESQRAELTESLEIKTPAAGPLPRRLLVEAGKATVPEISVEIPEHVPDIPGQVAPRSHQFDIPDLPNRQTDTLEPRPRLPKIERPGVLPTATSDIAPDLRGHSAFEAARPRNETINPRSTQPQFVAREIIESGEVGDLDKTPTEVTEILWETVSQDTPIEPRPEAPVVSAPQSRKSDSGLQPPRPRSGASINPISRPPLVVPREIIGSGEVDHLDKAPQEVTENLLETVNHDIPPAQQPLMPRIETVNPRSILPQVVPHEITESGEVVHLEKTPRAITEHLWETTSHDIPSTQQLETPVVPEHHNRATEEASQHLEFENSRHVVSSESRVELPHILSKATSHATSDSRNLDAPKSPRLQPEVIKPRHVLSEMPPRESEELPLEHPQLLSQTPDRDNPRSRRAEVTVLPELQSQAVNPPLLSEAKGRERLPNPDVEPREKPLTVTKQALPERQPTNGPVLPALQSQVVNPLPRLLGLGQRQAVVELTRNNLELEKVVLLPTGPGLAVTKKEVLPPRLWRYEHLGIDAHGLSNTDSINVDNSSSAQRAISVPAIFSPVTELGAGTTAGNLVRNLVMASEGPLDSPHILLEAETLPASSNVSKSGPVGVTSVNQPVDEIAKATPSRVPEMISKLVRADRRTLQKLEIHLEPNRLGRLKVELSVDPTTKKVETHMLVANEAAREALEQHLPNLRVRLQDQGFDIFTRLSTSSENPQHSDTHDRRRDGQSAFQGPSRRTAEESSQSSDDGGTNHGLYA